MFLRSRFTRATLCILVLALFACPSIATQTTKQLAPGVSLFQDINTNHGSELIVNSVSVDLKSPNVYLKAALCKDVVIVNDVYKGRETISSLTGRKGALVGINADFFPFTGDPTGVCIVNGELVSEATRHRAAIALLKNGSVAFDNPVHYAKLTLANGVSREISGINRDRETNQIVFYTNTFGASTYTKYAGTEVVLTSDNLPVRVGKEINLTVTEVHADAVNTLIPKGGAVLSAGGPAATFLKDNLKPGDKLAVRFDIKSDNGTDWSQVEEAVAGGPWLLKNGKQFIDYESEKIKSSFCSAKHPRTAVGVTADGKLLLVSVDGRQSISRGISLPGLSDLMSQLGAVNAINLDGGGSTTFSYRGIVVNSPSGGEQRPVADALLVFAAPPASVDIPKLAITGATNAIETGKGTQLSISCGDDSRPLSQEQLDRVVWGTTNGGGFVNQKGYITPIKLRRQSVKAFYGLQPVSCDVNVISGAPVKLDVVIIPDKQNLDRAQAIVTLTDVDSNPCVDKPVTLAITGGKSDFLEGKTNNRGEFIVSITWDKAASVHIVKAISDNLTQQAGN